MNLHCENCHEEHYFTMDEWYEVITHDYTGYDFQTDEGATLKWAVLNVNEGKKIVCSMTRHDLSSSIHILKKHGVFCAVPEDKTQ